MGIIYHIAPVERWEEAGMNGAYRGDSLATEGFIHCSTADQILRVANNFYKGRHGLVLLEIDEAKLIPEIRYEALVGTERFPHIYGPLNLDAVLRVRGFPPQPDGTFTLDE